jgi:hypothetical protein
LQADEQAFQLREPVDQGHHRDVAGVCHGLGCRNHRVGGTTLNG